MGQISCYDLLINVVGNVLAPTSATLTVSFITFIIS